MTQQFSKTDNPWSRLQPFEKGGITIYIQTYAGDDHSAATTVFTSKSGSEVFHADKHCHHLHSDDPLWNDSRFIYARPLEQVLSSYLAPIRPCAYCTQDIYTTVELVQEFDGVPESCLSYFEPGDEVVSTRTHTDPETGETTVEQSSKDAYPDGGSQE